MIAVPNQHFKGNQSSCCSNNNNHINKPSHNCRTCDMHYSDEENYSQCWQCRRIEALEAERLPNDWCCPTSKCNSQSKCFCNERQVCSKLEELKSRDCERQNSAQFYGSGSSCKNGRHCSTHSSEHCISDQEITVKQKSSMSDVIRNTEAKCLSWCRKINPASNDKSHCDYDNNCLEQNQQGFDDIHDPVNKFQKQEKINVPPLCSVRLQPTRHRTKNAILSILESGEVCFELLKKKGSLKEERVVDVCRISGDGFRVSLFLYFLKTNYCFR